MRTQSRKIFLRAAEILASTAERDEHRFACLCIEDAALEIAGTFGNRECRIFGQLFRRKANREGGWFGSRRLKKNAQRRILALGFAAACVKEFP